MKRASHMIVVLLAGLVAVATTQAQVSTKRPSHVVFAEGDTLESIAEKFLGSPRAADELRALNGLPPGVQPEPGKEVALPGPVREQAMTTLQLAEQALESARQEGAEEHAADTLQKAKATIEKAKKVFMNARYDQCLKLADEGWALAKLARKLSMEKQARINKFSVLVDENGTTRVAVEQGSGLKVVAGDKSAIVSPGQAVVVGTGDVDMKPRHTIPPPELVLPNPESTLVTRTVYFRWHSVEGAAKYVLTICGDARCRKPLWQITTSRTSYLYREREDKPGLRWWLVRSVDSQGVVGPPSKPRAYRLEPKSSPNDVVEREKKE